MGTTTPTPPGPGSSRPGPGRPARHLRLVPTGPEVVPAVPVRRSQVRPPLRLTRRGRRVLALALLGALAAAVLVGLRPVLAAAADALVTPPSGPTAEVVVLPGDTLWEIAVAVQPSRDPRDTIIDICHLNGMSQSRVFAGQRLVVPAGG